MYTSAKVLVFALCFYATLNPAAGTEGALFKVAHNYKMTGATVLENYTAPTMTIPLCALFCLVKDCKSATYSEGFKTCTTYGDTLYNPITSWIEDLDWCILYRPEPIQYGDWTMVFRAEKGINSSLYNHYMADGHSDDLDVFNDFPIGCYRVDNMDTCTRHFRSALLDNWVNIDQVRFSLYTNGTEVAYIIFNGLSTTRQSWFAQELILESSWTSIQNDPLVQNFDFEGFVYDNHVLRRLVICGGYGGCDIDTTYFLAIDVDHDGCTGEWSMSAANYPTFVYSPFNRLVRLNQVPSEYMFADVMAIFVKHTTPP